MEHTQKIAFTKAIALLNAAGAKYAVIHPDTGETIGELTVMLEKERRHKRTGIDYKPLYKEALETLEAGNVLKLTTPDDMEPERLRSTLTAAAFHKFGKGNCISSVVGRSVELLRVA